jgi:hypothetical protein
MMTPLSNFPRRECFGIFGYLAGLAGVAIALFVLLQSIGSPVSSRETTGAGARESAAVSRPERWKADAIRIDWRSATWLPPAAPGGGRSDSAPPPYAAMAKKQAQAKIEALKERRSVRAGARRGAPRPADAPAYAATASYAVPDRQKSE